MTTTAHEPAPPVSSSAPVRRERRWKRILGFAALGIAGLFVVAQFVPYGHSYVPIGHPKGNPAVTKAAVWPDAPGENLARGACYDCHSNLTNWWLGTKVAPMSWLAQNDVDGGRNALNFSRWDTPQPSLDDVVESVNGGMPPIQYWVIHPNAHLSAAEKARLSDALRALYRTDPPAGIRGGG